MAVCYLRTAFNMTIFSSWKLIYFQGRSTLSKSFLLPSEKGLLQGSKFLPFRVDLFPVGT